MAAVLENATQITRLVLTCSSVSETQNFVRFLKSYNLPDQETGREPVISDNKVFLEIHQDQQIDFGILMRHFNNQN